MKITFRGKNSIPAINTFVQPKVYISPPLKPSVIKDIADFNVKTIDVFSKNGLIQNFIKYRNKIIEELKKYRQDGSVEFQRIFNNKGDKKNYYNSDNQITKSEEFRENGTLDSLTKYKPDNSVIKIHFFDDANKPKINSLSSYDTDGVLINRKERLEDGSLDFITKRQPDGTYIQKGFDEDGIVEEITLLDADENLISSRGFNSETKEYYLIKYNPDGTFIQTNFLEDSKTLKAISKYDINDKLIAMKEFRDDETLEYVIERKSDGSYTQYNYDKKGENIEETLNLDANEKPISSEGIDPEDSTPFFKEFNADGSYMQTCLFEDGKTIKSIGNYDDKNKLVEAKEYRLDGTNYSYRKRMEDGSYREEYFDKTGENIIQINEMDENMQPKIITEFLPDGTKIVVEFNATAKISTVREFNQYGQEQLDFSPKPSYDDLTPTIKTTDLTEFEFSLDKLEDLSKLPDENPFPTEGKWDLSRNPPKKLTTPNDDLPNLDDIPHRLFDSDDLEDFVEGEASFFGDRFPFSEN